MSSAPTYAPLSSAPQISGLEPVEARQIFINDISGDTTTSDLRTLFASAGKVTNVEIDTNELNRHFAFVTFESSSGVEQAIANFTTTNLNNTTLVCRRRTELEQMRQKRMTEARCKLFVGNIPQTLTPEELRSEIQRVSQRPIIDFRHKKGYCFVGYSSPQDAEVAKHNLTNAVCGGKSLNAEFKKEDPIRNEPGFIAVLEQAQRTLYVRDIPTSTSPERFRGIFEQYGKVRKFTLPTESRSNKLVGYAFIEYFWKEDCNKALAQTQSLLLDGVQIEIRISDPPKQDKGRFGRFDRGRGMSGGGGGRGSYGSGGGGGGGRYGRERRDSRGYGGGGRDYRDRGRGMDRGRGGYRRSRSRSRSRSRERGRYPPTSGHRGYGSHYAAAPVYGQPAPSPYGAAPHSAYPPPPAPYHSRAAPYNPYAPPTTAAPAATTAAPANPAYPPTSYGYNYGAYASYPYSTAPPQNGSTTAAPAQQPAQSANGSAAQNQQPQTQPPQQSQQPQYGAAATQAQQPYAYAQPPYQQQQPAQQQQPPPQQAPAQQNGAPKGNPQQTQGQQPAPQSNGAAPPAAYPYYQGAQSNAYPANYYQQPTAAKAQAPQQYPGYPPQGNYQYPASGR